MSLNFSTALRNARALAIITALDSGAAHATMQFYSGTKPATGATITTQTLLGTVTLSKPCAAILNGIITFEPIAADPVADATGVISWARALSGAGDFVFDMNCGIDNNAVITFNNVDVLIGSIIAINSGTLTEGNL